MIGERLKQARELNNFTQEHLAQLVDVKQATIAMIEREALAPRDELVSAIAEKTSFPRDFFDLPIDTDFPLGSLVYRKFARMRAEDKKVSHRLAQQAFELSEFFAARMKPITVGLPRLAEDPVTAAQVVRNAIGVDATSPINNLVHRLERIGVRVFMLPAAIPDLDAFSIMANGRPVVVLNPTAHGDRQTFSLAHEMGHLVMHYPFTGTQEGIEDEADTFAAELLMPEEAMRSEMTEPITLSLLAQLKARWRVSIAALLQRAKELGLVTERQFKYLRMQMARRGWTKVEPVPIPPESPRGLRKMAEVVYGQQPNFRKIAKDAKRPPFLVAQLINAAQQVGEAVGKLLTFRADEEAMA